MLGLQATQRQTPQRQQQVHPLELTYLQQRQQEQKQPLDFAPASSPVTTTRWMPHQGMPRRLHPCPLRSRLELQEKTP
jgi:hypothetical protein